MRATEGFRTVKCSTCSEQYEIAVNRWNSTIPACVVRTAQGRKCGGVLKEVKSVGPARLARPIPEIAANSDDMADLDAMLAPANELGRFLCPKPKA